MKKRKRMPVVTLSEIEKQEIKDYSDMMHEKAKRGEFKLQWGQTIERFYFDMVVGTIGHRGAAKWFGAQWIPQLDPDGGYDLGMSQIRSTIYKPTRTKCFLIGHKENHPIQINILVVVNMDSMASKLIGWQCGEFIMQEKYWLPEGLDGRACYAVHHLLLN